VLLCECENLSRKILQLQKYEPTRMSANEQRDGRLPKIGGALCSTPQSLADAHYQSGVQ